VVQTDGSAYLRLGYETGSEKYRWLNRVVGIGKLTLVGDNDLTIDAWAVSPATVSRG